MSIRSGVSFATLAAFSIANALMADEGVSRTRDNEALLALWLVHAYGTPEAVEPARDGSIKAEIAKALRQGSLNEAAFKGFLPPATFVRLAGDDGLLELPEIRRHLDSAEPAVRKRLLPRVESHVRFLTTGFDRIDESYREPSRELVDWIVENHRSGKPLSINCICTGNSRRSMLGATMGNIAAAYYGLDICCYSGGTKPSVFNARTQAALREIGVEIEATAEQAPPGPAMAANPIYRVRWGESSGGIALESREFSKSYDDPHNPAAGFAAVILCSEADSSCPMVKGAAIRVAVPFADPNFYDDSEFEARKYAEKRDDIARMMLAIMMQARLRLAAAGNSPERLAQ